MEDTCCVPNAQGQDVTSCPVSGTRGKGVPLITLKALRLLRAAPVVGYFVAKGKKGKKGKSRGPTPPKAARGGFPGMPGGMPAGFPDLSNMPPGLDQRPPGLEGIDISQFQQPKKK